MTRWLIFEATIAGRLDANVDPPPGYEVVEGIDAPEEDVCYLNGEIVLKPPRPEEPSYWDGEEWALIVPPNTAPSPTLNFAGLENTFRNTEIFERVGMAAAQNTAANFYLTMILYAMTAGQASTVYVDQLETQPSRSLDDLRFGFTNIRPVMASLGLDFTPEQLQSIKEALLANNFDPAWFGFEPEQPEEQVE